MKKRYLIPLVILGVMLLLNAASWLSTEFSDFYVLKIFPYISAPFIFLSGLFPFSVGEILIILAVLFVIVGVPLFVVLLIFGRKLRRKTASFFGTAMLWILTFIITTETMNCFIMYHCTPFSERYFSGTAQHTRQELTDVYALLIEECNSLSQQVLRDENGFFLLSGDTVEEAKRAMENAAEEYSQLKGYYPRPKPISFSYLMSQMGILGVYFPFSMEANYNRDIYEVNLPNTLCHEYAHLKGIIQEDEAGFIAFIASTQSESADFRYSGYLNALEYVHNEIYESNISQAFYLTDTISPEVRNDWFRFVPENYWEENEEKEIISTETVDTISSGATDTTLKINGVEDGIESYTRIVNLILDYYYPPEE